MNPNDSDTYNPVPGVMDGVPSSRNYIGGFASKLMVCVQSCLDVVQPYYIQAKTLENMKVQFYIYK